MGLFGCGRLGVFGLACFGSGVGGTASVEMLEMVRTGGFLSVSVLFVSWY